jgi:hypothetical protein
MNRNPVKEELKSIFTHIDQLAAEAGRKKKRSVFLVQFFPSPKDTRVVAPKNRETSHNLLGFCEIGRLVHLENILRYLEGRIDFLLLDMDKKLPGLEDAYHCAAEILKQTQLYIYSETDIWHDALLAMSTQMSTPGQQALLVGNSPLTYKLALSLVERSYPVSLKSAVHSSDLNEVIRGLNRMKSAQQLQQVSVFSETDSKTFDIVIGTEFKEPVVDESIIHRCKPGALIIDGGIGTISVSAISRAREKNLQLLRLDNRAAVSACVQTILETRDLIRNRMGREFIAGVHVVAGGVMGHAGDVIVDSISQPSTVIGVADGSGRTRPEPFSNIDQKNVDRIVQLFKAAGGHGIEH